MPSATQVFPHCDQIENLPQLCRDNWLFELDFLRRKLILGASVLQVGAMDGTRIVALADVRPDLVLTGFEIEDAFVLRANRVIAEKKINAQVILGDITDGEDALSMGNDDVCICLNNTFGYIEQRESALLNMKEIAPVTYISVFEDKFTDELAHEYFSCLGLEIEKIEGRIIHLKDFGFMKRFRRREVEAWNGEIFETPLGSFCKIES